MDEILTYLTRAFTLSFVVTSMFGFGLGLTVQQIVKPLKNVRLVIAALAANFVVMPGMAFALTRVLPLDQDLQIGLLLLGSAAGAALTLKATQICRGNLLLAVSIVTLLVVTTVIYLPLVLPLLIPGVEVDPVALALPLFMQMIVPLAAGLLMNARYDEEAEMTRPIMTEISSISLALLIVVNLANLRGVLSLVGTGAIIAILIMIATGLGAGYLFSSSLPQIRRTFAMATAHRNYAAAFVIAGGSFADRPNVFLLLLTASLISMAVILIAAGEFRRRVEATNPA